MGLREGGGCFMLCYSCCAPQLMTWVDGKGRHGCVRVPIGKLFDQISQDTGKCVFSLKVGFRNCPKHLMHMYL